MIPRHKFYLGKVLGPMKLINEVFHSWYGISILDYILIKHLIVNANSHSSIFLLHQNKQGGKSATT